MRASLAVLLLVSGVLAGCTDNDRMPSGPGIVEDAAWAVSALYGTIDPNETDHLHPDDEHDHNDPAHHQNMTSANVQALGHDPLASDYHGGVPAGGYYCGGTGHDGARQLAVVSSFLSNLAVAVVDVTDPTAPKKLGEYVLERAHIYDAAMTGDGRYVALATSPLEAITEDDPNDPRLPVPPASATPAQADGATNQEPALWWRGCGGDRLIQGPESRVPFNNGVVLVDASDPTAPVFADYNPQPALGPHSIDATTIGADQYITASTTNLVYQVSYVTIYTVLESPLGARLTPLVTYDAHYDYDGDPGVDQDGDASDTLFSAIDLANGHVDATFRQHPNGDLLLYFSNWDGGLQILRYDGPGQLTQLSVWGAVDPTQGYQDTGNIHSALPLPDIWHDRHITVVGQEVVGRPESRPTGQIVLLDTTFPEAPEPVARWTLPVDIASWRSLHFSTHYSAFDPERDILYTAMYHGGVWAADARPEHWPELPSLAAFVPADTTAEPAVPTLAPEVLDVFTLAGGNVLAFDANSGAYVFRVERDPDVPLAAPWMEDAWIGHPGSP